MLFPFPSLNFGDVLPERQMSMGLFRWDLREFMGMLHVLVPDNHSVMTDGARFANCVVKCLGCDVRRFTISSVNILSYPATCVFLFS